MPLKIPFLANFPFLPHRLKGRLALRSRPVLVPVEQGRAYFGLIEGFRPLRYVANDFEAYDNGTVIDHTTGLMWQTTGPSKRICYEDARAYIKDLNSNACGAHLGWRFPTIPELLSLVEREKKTNGLHIDSLFDPTQTECWSADMCPAGHRWLVDFRDGTVTRSDFLIAQYLRSVRSCREDLENGNTEYIKNRNGKDSARTPASSGVNGPGNKVEVVPAVKNEDNADIMVAVRMDPETSDDLKEAFLKRYGCFRPTGTLFADYRDILKCAGQGDAGLEFISEFSQRFFALPSEEILDSWLKQNSRQFYVIPMLDPACESRYETMYEWSPLESYLQLWKGKNFMKLNHLPRSWSGITWGTKGWIPEGSPVDTVPVLNSSIGCYTIKEVYRLEGLPENPSDLTVEHFVVFQDRDLEAVREVHVSPAGWVEFIMSTNPYKSFPLLVKRTEGGWEFEKGTQKFPFRTTWRDTDLAGDDPSYEW